MKHDHLFSVWLISWRLYIGLPASVQPWLLWLRLYSRGRWLSVPHVCGCNQTESDRLGLQHVAPLLVLLQSAASEIWPDFVCIVDSCGSETRSSAVRQTADPGRRTPMQSGSQLNAGEHCYRFMTKKVFFMGNVVILQHLNQVSNRKMNLYLMLKSKPSSTNAFKNKMTSN